MGTIVSRAIRQTLGRKVKHRCSAYMNRRIERDHRGVKQLLSDAGLWCTAIDPAILSSLRRSWQYFRPRRKQKEVVSLANARRLFLSRALQRHSITGYIINLTPKADFIYLVPAVLTISPREPRTNFLRRTAVQCR